MDAYTIKKMLPRLLIAIILVNLSWDICRITIDYVNIIGNSIGGLIAGLSPGESATADSIGLIGQIGIAGGATAAVLATSGGILVSLIMLVALALFTGFVALSLRQIVILVMVIISPIALVLWVFPGMDKWAKRWWDIFIKALLMFPFMMAMIAAGQLVSSVIVLADSDNLAVEISAVLVKFIPFFLLPFAMKLAGGTLANVSGMINDRSRGLLDLQRKRNSAKVGENWNAMRMGRRFSGDNAVANTLNKAGLLAARPTYGVGRYNLPYGIGKKARGEVKLARDREKYEAQEELYKHGVRDHDTANELMVYGSSGGRLRERVAELRSQGRLDAAQRLERVQHLSGDRYRLGAMEIAAGFGKVDDRALRALDEIYSKPEQEGEKQATLQSIREASKSKMNFATYSAKMVDVRDEQGRKIGTRIETYSKSEEEIAQEQAAANAAHLAAGGVGPAPEVSKINESAQERFSLYMQDAGPGILGQVKQFETLDSKGNKIYDSKSATASALARSAVNDLGVLASPMGNKGKVIDGATGEIVERTMTPEEIKQRQRRAVEVVAQMRQTGAYDDFNTKTAIDRAYDTYIASDPAMSELYKQVENDLIYRGRQPGAMEDNAPAAGSAPPPPPPPPSIPPSSGPTYGSSSNPFPRDDE